MHRVIFVFSSLLLIALTFGCDRSVETSADDGQVDSYAVGSTTFFIHDESRPFDAVAGVNTGVRTLITEVWYPVDAAATGDSRRATYGDYVFGSPEVHELMITGTTFFHLTPDSVREGVTQAQIDAAIDELFLRERSSFVDAQLASGGAFPVVVMTHGDAGSRYNMESACEHLAANGYVVIAAEHTGNSPYSLSGKDPALQSDSEFRAKMQDVLPMLGPHGVYGPSDNFGQSYSPLLGDNDPVEALRLLDRSLLQRLNDLRAVLRKLDEMNTQGQFAGRLALDRIGLMGRSFGGSTTLMGLAMEPRFTSGFAVVPPGWTDMRSALPPEALFGDGEEAVLLSAGDEFPLGTITKPTVLLSGAEDSLIIGLAARVGATATPENPHPVLRQMFESTSAPVVWGLLANSNHGSFGVSGPYWWPELKPNRQARHFAPEEEFELIAPNVAHQMQKELALHFFDATIREEAAAVGRLSDVGERFAPQGLALELRNF